jgi:hypothetical protein
MAQTGARHLNRLGWSSAAAGQWPPGGLRPAVASWRLRPCPNDTLPMFLQDQRDQPITDTCRIFVVAFEPSPKRPFLDPNTDAK